ncbi:MAG: porin [Proteobacteria bacterium]|nr:porin [Pseudomonadota bacterium]
MSLKTRKAGAMRAATLALLLAGVAAPALAAPKADPRDARIEQLEAQVRQLMEDHQRLAAEDQQLMAQAQQLAAEVAALKTGQQAQAQAVQTVQTAQAAQAEAAAKKPAPGSVVTTMAAGRPIWSTADGRFTASVHAILQLDAGRYSQAAAGPIATDLRRSGPALGATSGNVDLTHARDLKDGVDFRRARLGVDGTAFGDWDYKLILDFGGTGVENTGQLYEGWVQYSGLKPVRIRVGAFSPSIGLEDQASTNSMPFLERSAVEDMARGLAAGDTRVNAEVFANGPHWLVSGAITGRTIGVINTGTAAATAQTYGDQLGFVGRVAATPLHGSDWLVHVGAHGSYVDRLADTTGPGTNGVTPITAYAVGFSNTQELRIDGTKLINTGNITADHASTVGLEFAAQKANFLVQSEYERLAVSRTDGAASPHFSGWYVEGLWMLTGEQRKYNAQTAAFDAPPVAHPFSWKDGTWGAWEIGLRWSEVNLNYRAGATGTAPGADSIRGGDEQNLALGLNWWPNPLVRFMFDYEHVKIDRLSPSAALFQTPTGAQIGQTYDTIAVRSQFAF